MEYQHNFSTLHESMFDTESRRRKAETAVHVLDDFLGDQLSSARLLNVGSSSGIMDSVFATRLRDVVGIDIDEGAILHARRTYQRDNLRFELGDGLAIPFEDSSFDVLVCSQVYEHVPDQPRLMAEIERVLRPGGVCYFAATNRFILMEPHYRLPFLSWLPRPLANAYLRVTGKGERYFERLLSYPKLRRLTARFELIDYTAKVLDDPGKYAVEYMVRPGTAMQRIARFVAVRLRWICPGYLWILRKRNAPADIATASTRTAAT